jgi:superfamily II DNA/RNA helicase
MPVKNSDGFMGEFEGFIEGIDPFFSEKLRKKNIKTPTAIQKIIIPRILNNESLAFCSETGTGKTFAYLLPVLQNITGGGADPQNKGRCRALILSPTLELCSQIKNEASFLLRGLEIGGRSMYENFKPLLVTSAMNTGRQIDTIKKNKPAIIAANAARLLRLLNMGKLKLNHAEYLILDEADRLISDEQAEETAEVLKYVNPGAVKIACSATLSQKTLARLRALWGETPVYESGEQEILRNNILHWAVWAEDRDKVNALRSFLSAARPKRALVFAERAEIISEIVSKLNHHKYGASGLYSGIDKKTRGNALEDFRSGRLPVLVCSDLAARGLDIEDVTHIVTMGVNEDYEVYIHRAGRTARAGKKGVMLSIGSEADLRRLRAIEQRLKIIVYPKILYKGRICSPDEFD